MGFRRPLCKKDFKRNKKNWEELCIGGAAQDVVNIVKNICENKDKQKNND